MQTQVYNYDVDLHVDTKTSAQTYTGRYTDDSNMVYNLGSYYTITEVSNMLAATLASKIGFNHDVRGYTDIEGDLQVVTTTTVPGKAGTVTSSTATHNLKYWFKNCSHHIQDGEYVKNGSTVTHIVKNYLKAQHGFTGDFTCKFSNLKASANVAQSKCRYVVYTPVVQQTAPTVVPNVKPSPAPVVKPEPVEVEVDMGGLFGGDGGDY